MTVRLIATSSPDRWHDADKTFIVQQDAANFWVELAIDVGGNRVGSIELTKPLSRKEGILVPKAQHVPPQSKGTFWRNRRRYHMNTTRGSVLITTWVIGRRFFEIPNLQVFEIEHITTARLTWLLATGYLVYILDLLRLVVLWTIVAALSTLAIALGLLIMLVPGFILAVIIWGRRLARGELNSKVFCIYLFLVGCAGIPLEIILYFVLKRRVQKVRDL